MKKLILLFILTAFNCVFSQSIISVSPNNANRGQNLGVLITGQDIDFSETSSTTSVSIIDQYSNILSATSLEVYYDEIYAYFSIPSYAIAGQYDVNVNDTEGSFDMTLTNGFTINNAFTYTIQGNIRYDSNSNGCDPSDSYLPNQKLIYTNGSNSGNLIANETGFYSFYDVQVGNNSFSPVIENQSYFTITPPSASVTISAANNLFVQDFCISPNGIHNDLEISIFPVTSALPGFDAKYKIIYKNKGTHLQNGSVSLEFGDSVMDLISALPVISSQTTNILNWSFSNLLPFETREIFVTMNINSPMETPSVNAGNLLAFNAIINGATDETPSDNTSALTQTVVGSYDPNDKTCVEGVNLPVYKVGEYVHYVIRFENTGTANAENIVIRDVIDTSKFDISSLISLSGSASYITRITNTNQVEFIFENINLSFDNVNNDGYVAFKIKTKSTLVDGDTFSNTANIYFDYNFPIVTNTYTTLVYNPLNINTFDFSSVFSLSPVPTKDKLTITCNQEIKISSISIYNTIGQLVQVSSNPLKTIDVTGLKTGNYFIKIISDKGTATGKFIKE